MAVQSPKSQVRHRGTPSDVNLDCQAKVNAGELRNELREALRATGYFVDSQSEITVDVSSDGHVLLRGIVSSYYHKQQAQVAAMSVNGVCSLQNDLVVK